jgi:hypothetical protein
VHLPIERPSGERAGIEAIQSRKYLLVQRSLSCRTSMAGMSSAFLRHPAQNWHWLLLLGYLFLAVVIISIVASRRLAQSGETEVAAARG